MINKKKFPNLYRFRELGSYKTPEGMEYFKKYEPYILMEQNIRIFARVERMFGDKNRKIHMPDEQVNQQ